MKQPIGAYITEFSDDGGQSWEVGNIAWFAENLVKEAEQIPFPWRISHVLIFPGNGPLSREDLDRKIETHHKLEDLFPSS